MWQIKGDVLPSIYSSFLKKCKLGVMIINQLVLPFSRKRPVTCYIITQYHLVSKINSSFSSCFMIFEFRCLKSNFSYRNGGEYYRYWNFFFFKVSHHLSSQWGEQEDFLSPLPSLLIPPILFKLLFFSHKFEQVELLRLC